MPQAVHEKLAIEAATLAQLPTISVTFRSTNFVKDSDGNYVDRVLETLRDKLVDLDSRKKWDLPDQTIPILVGEIVGSRMQMGSNGLNTLIPDLTKSFEARYNESLGFLLNIVGLMRQSPKLSDQDWCDQLEVFMLRECLQERAADSISSDLHTRLVKQLSDSDSRYRSRRKAIALSWHRLQSLDSNSTSDSNQWLDSGGRPMLGGHQLFGYDRSKSAKSEFPMVMRRASLVTYEMLDCLERGRSEAMSLEAMHTRLSAAWSIRDRGNQFGNHADTANALQPYLPTSPISSNYLSYPSHLPCTLWYGEWESAAERLKTSIKNEKTILEPL